MKGDSRKARKKLAYIEERNAKKVELIDYTRKKLKLKRFSDLEYSKMYDMSLDRLRLYLRKKEKSFKGFSLVESLEREP
jgi:hypothetical protein